MKINEKHLVSFACSNTHIDREGWLKKRGDVNKGFQRRYFVLKGNLLFYFEKQGDKEPIGLVVLEGCTIELAENEEAYTFKIVFHAPGNRQYILGTESQETMEQWMKSLTYCSYDYMKLMVDELQRQLDEVGELPTVVDNSSIQRFGVAKEGKSPNPPPRQRQNPFNKPNEGPYPNHHHRSHSLRVRNESDGSASGRGETSHKGRANFRDIHKAYGRRVLADFNEWKHDKKQNKAATHQPLISL